MTWWQIIARHMLLALQHLHAQDIAHLDMKPANVFVSLDGGGDESGGSSGSDAAGVVRDGVPTATMKVAATTNPSR